MQNPDPPKDTVQHQAASAQHVLQVHLAHRASAAHKELWPLHQSHGPRVDSTTTVTTPQRSMRRFSRRTIRRKKVVVAAS